MSDRPRVPPDISDVRRTSRGWEARVGLYTDEAGFFGRRCPDPECRTFFKLNVAEYKAAPESLQLTCPVCGLVAHHQGFITPEQKQRGEAAALEFARATADQVIRDWSRRQASRPRHSSGVRIEWTDASSRPISDSTRDAAVHHRRASRRSQWVTRELDRLVGGRFALTMAGGITPEWYRSADRTLEAR